MACVDLASEAIDLHRILPRSIGERPRNATRKSSSAADVSGRIDIAQRAGIPDVESDQPMRELARATIGDELARLPLVLLADGTALAMPTHAELAEKVRRAYEAKGEVAPQPVPVKEVVAG